VEEHKAIADVYQSTPDGSADPATIQAYQALAQETLEQYKAITDSGVSIEAWAGEGEPYANSAAMIADTKKGHIYFLPTDTAFGNGGVNTTHPMLAPTNITVPTSDGKVHQMLVNDAFRVVHDWVAHGAFESQFGPVGEEQAWVAHMATLKSREAKRALTAETRGQNSWVNFGAHIRRTDGSIPIKTDGDYKPLKDRPFAEQKIILLPEKYSVTGIDEVDGKRLLADLQIDTDLNPQQESAFRESVENVLQTHPDGAAIAAHIAFEVNNPDNPRLDGRPEQTVTPKIATVKSIVRAIHRYNLAFPGSPVDVNEMLRTARESTRGL
jgi:hypothetical protein